MEAEVLVMGGGPAGSVASALLARAGRRVLCLEAGTFPRFQIGESLLPRCNDILDEAGLLSAVQARGFMEKPAALFLDGPTRERFSFAEMFPGQRPSALQVVRSDFDQTLSTAARQHGAKVLFQQRVDAIDFEADGTSVTHVTNVETNERYDVHARMVLDCSGYGRVLPKLLSLETKPTLGPKVAVFNHFEGDVRPKGPEEGDIWITVHPDGPWFWLIPFSNGRTSVGVVGERSIIDAAGANDAGRLAKLMATDPNVTVRLRDATPTMKTQRLEGWSASVSRFHGPGWAVCGNASEFLDPVFSSGVTLALESASRAAKLAHRQLAGETVDWEADYTKVMSRAVGVFKVFVMSWYSGALQKVLLREKKDPLIKRSITAVLGGYVLDEANPFVRDGQKMIEAIAKLS
ncbi:MAG: tryptophan 7-halogenase [Myxococcaceae bacterium]|nr:tryptophan 7-halogenase [Myxococcaceae bacterium]